MPRRFDRAMVVSGTKRNPNPTPRRISGQKKSWRSEARVECESRKVKKKKVKQKKVNEVKKKEEETAYEVNVYEVKKEDDHLHEVKEE